MIGDLIALVLADATVSAAIGTRLRPITRDQTDTTPAATVNVISGVSDLANDGPTGYQASRVQVDVYAITAAAAYAAANAIKARLHGFAGVQGTTRFLGIISDSERTSFDASGAATSASPAEDRLVRISLDFMVHWRTAQ